VVRFYASESYWLRHVVTTIYNNTNNYVSIYARLMTLNHYAYSHLISSHFKLQSWTKPLRQFQPILQIQCRNNFWGKIVSTSYVQDCSIASRPMCTIAKYINNTGNAISETPLKARVFDTKLVAWPLVLPACRPKGTDSGPASKARYFVLSAFAHERGILIGCLLLDSIIRSVIHHKGSRYSLDKLKIRKLITFFDYKWNKNRLFIVYLKEEILDTLYVSQENDLLVDVEMQLHVSLFETLCDLQGFAERAKQKTSSLPNEITEINFVLSTANKYCTHDLIIENEHLEIWQLLTALLAFLELKRSHLHICSSNIDSIHYLGLTNSFHQVPRNIHTLSSIIEVYEYLVELDQMNWSARVMRAHYQFPWACTRAMPAHCITLFIVSIMFRQCRDLTFSQLFINFTINKTIEETAFGLLPSLQSQKFHGCVLLSGYSRPQPFLIIQIFGRLVHRRENRSDWKPLLAGYAMIFHAPLHPHQIYIPYKPAKFYPQNYFAKKSFKLKINYILSHRSFLVVNPFHAWLIKFNIISFLTLEEWAFLLGTTNEIALLGIKCLYELQDVDIMKSVSSKFLARDGKLDLKSLNIAAVDSAALFTFLGNSKNLKELAFFECRIQDNYNYHFKSFMVNTAGNNITSFMWYDGYLEDVAVEYLSEALKSENCKLTELNLVANEITDQGVEYLSEALKSENCKLTELNLVANEITDQGVEYLSEALKSENCKLTELNLGANQITDQGVEYLSEALKSENCKLTELNLVANEITDQGVEYLSEALKSENCKLTKLNLYRNEITDQGVEYLSEGLKSENCKLTKLNLHGNKITHQGVEYLSEALKSENCKLTELDLASNKITDQGVEYLSEALKSKNCKLTELNLHGNEITDQGVEYLSEGLKSENCKLTKLNLHGNEITDQGVEYLSEGLKSENCKLTKLNLHGNEITDQGVEYLSEGLKSENCKLTKLNLHGNEITDQGVEYLSEGLKSENCKLTKLNLHGNEITDQGVEYLSEGLKSENCKLTKLNLHGNEITDQGVEYLSEGLKSENCKLTKLNLHGNEITDQGVEYLSEGLKSENCKLTKLNLVANEITDQGVEYLSEALKSENCKLTKLNLFGNEITDQGVEYLSEALKSENCKLTKLNLGRNKIADQGVEYLSEALKSENCKLILN
ncbi:NACHT, LRR and PYD domains-containing 12-like isoform X1, partial [Paramuricea clavata]